MWLLCLYTVLYTLLYTLLYIASVSCVPLMRTHCDHSIITGILLLLLLLSFFLSLQMPALVHSELGTDAVTLVVCPLLALMQDQVYCALVPCSLCSPLVCPL